MHPAYRFFVQAFFVTAIVTISYLLSCLMGTTYDPLQFAITATIGLIAGLGFAGRQWWRGRAARQR